MKRWSNVAVAENNTLNVNVWLHERSALMMHASTEKVRKQTPGCMVIDGDAILHTCVEIHNVYFGIV